MKKTKLIIGCTLLLTLFLTGCGLFKSDTQKLTELLEDKYGEEFGVESYYYAGDMWAMCYPVSDPTLLFEVRTDGDVTFIGHDYYLQTVVQRQVEAELQPLVEQAFPGSFVSAYIGNTLKTIPETFPKANEVGINDIIEYCTQTGTSSDIVINIFVDTSQMTEESSEENEETGILSGFISKTEDIISNLGDNVSGVIEKGQKALSNFIDAIAILLITSCVIPVAVLIFFMWIIKIIFGINIPVPDVKNYTDKEYFKKSSILIKGQLYGLEKHFSVTSSLVNKQTLTT